MSEPLSHYSDVNPAFDCARSRRDAIGQFVVHMSNLSERVRLRTVVGESATGRAAVVTLHVETCPVPGRPTVAAI